MTARRGSTRLMAGLALGVGGTVLLGRALGARRPEPTITYPPLDTPKPVAEDIWIVDSGPIDALGLELPVRMTVVRFSGGNLLLHSPTRFSASLAGKLGELGRVRHLVAPSIAHWTFLPNWQHAFPDARTWATPRLRDRAPVRQSGLQIDADLGDTAPPDWSEEVQQGVVRGAAGFTETWFLHRPSRTLILTDLIENLEPGRLPLATALLMGAALATRATTALHVRALLALRGQATKAAIGAMVDLAPERVVFSHGRWFERDGAIRLRDALAWLLGPPGAATYRG